MIYYSSDGLSQVWSVGQSPRLTCNELNKQPRFERREGVMVEVQPRDLALLFAQHEKYRVRELGELREVVHPAEMEHLRKKRTS